MKNAFILTAVAIILVLGIAMIVYFSSKNINENSTSINSVASSISSTATTSESSGNTKIFSLTGENYKFFMNGGEAPTLTVRQGDKVHIDFESIGGFHDWVVDEFNARTTKVNDGGTTSVEFIADKKGTFEYYCSVGQHRSMGMKGNLVVE